MDPVFPPAALRFISNSYTGGIAPIIRVDRNICNQTRFDQNPSIPKQHFLDPSPSGGALEPRTFPVGYFTYVENKRGTKRR
jgi:hypothetical protein